MGPLFVVFGDPSIKVGLQLVDGVVDLLAERDPVKLVQDSAMEALADSVRLWALCLCAAVIDVLNREIELVFMALGAAKLGAAIGQHARQSDTVLVIKRHHSVIEDLGRGDRGLAVIQLGKGDLGIGIDEGLLIDPPDALQGADIEGVLRPAIAGARSRTRRAPPCRPWPSRGRRSAPRSTGYHPAPLWLRGPSGAASLRSGRGAAIRSAPQPARSTSRGA